MKFKQFLLLVFLSVIAMTVQALPPPVVVAHTLPQIAERTALLPEVLPCQPFLAPTNLPLQVPWVAFTTQPLKTGKSISAKKNPTVAVVGSSTVVVDPVYPCTETYCAVDDPVPKNSVQT